MNAEDIAASYRQRSLPELEKLAQDLGRLTPDAIPLLQAELLRREAWDTAMEITRTLTQRKFLTDDSSLMMGYVTYLWQFQRQEEAARQMGETFGIDANYLQLLRQKVRSEGRDHIILGSALFLIPTMATLVLLAMGLFGGILPLVLSIFGVVRLYKGIRQLRALRIR